MSESESTKTRQWMKFFLGAGIPSENAAQYAVTFTENRMGLHMLLDLDKDILRDLNITVLGDIIGILKHAKTVAAARSKDELLKGASRSGSTVAVPPTAAPSTTSYPLRPHRNPAGRTVNIYPKKLEVEETKVESSSEGEEEEEDEEEAEDGDIRKDERNKSVFSRLGVQNSEDRAEHKHQQDGAGEQRKLNITSSSSGGIFSRLGGTVEAAGTQEARVSSTTELAATPATPAGLKGILKRRGTGGGERQLARSKSAPNIISLKSGGGTGGGQARKKRISFGKDEISWLEPSPGIQSRLGYGRCASPPPEITEPALQTEMKKIAVGGGKFEIRKVMKVVKQLVKPELERVSVTPERVEVRATARSPARDPAARPAVETPPAREQQANPVKPIKISIKNNLAAAGDETLQEYRVDKVDLALRAAKLQSNLAGRREKERGQEKPRKRLAKYETQADGTVTKEYIGYDDPILETVPIKKQRTESSRPVSAERETEAVVTTLGAGLKITRTALNTLEADRTPHKTLAQKANQARTKQEKFETLASRASSSSVKSRLDGRGYSSEGESEAGRTSAGSVLSRVGPSRAPVTAPIRERFGSEPVRGKIFSRLGTKE